MQKGQNMSNNHEINRMLTLSSSLILNATDRKRLINNETESQTYDLRKDKNSKALDFIIYPAVTKDNNEFFDLEMLLCLAKDMGCQILRLKEGGPIPMYLYNNAKNSNRVTYTPALVQNISNIGTISISEKSRDLLTRLANDKNYKAITSKNGFGWFIENEEFLKIENLPDDITYQIKQSINHNCAMTCFDSDVISKF